VGRAGRSEFSTLGGGSCIRRKGGRNPEGGEEQSSFCGVSSDSLMGRSFAKKTHCLDFLRLEGGGKSIREDFVNSKTGYKETSPNLSRNDWRENSGTKMQCVCYTEEGTLRRRERWEKKGVGAFGQSWVMGKRSKNAPFASGPAGGKSQFSCLNPAPERLTGSKPLTREKDYIRRINATQQRKRSDRGHRHQK